MTEGLHGRTGELEAPLSMLDRRTDVAQGRVGRSALAPNVASGHHAGVNASIRIEHG